MKFQKGQSGNPSGRPRSTARTVLRKGIEKELPAIVNKLVEQAKAGDVLAARTLLERGLPALKPEAAPVVLPGVAAALTPTEQAQMVIKAAAEGQLAPDIAAQLLSGLGQAARVRESDELAREIEELKKRIAK